MFKMTTTLLKQLEEDYGTAIDALFVNHPGLDMESLFPACAGYILAPTVRLVYSRARLNNLFTLAGYSTGMAHTVLDKYMLNTYFKPGSTPRAVIMEDMVEEAEVKPGPAKPEAKPVPAKPRYRMLKIGEIIPYNAEFEVERDIWSVTTNGGTRYDETDKDFDLNYRVPITAEPDKVTSYVYPVPPKGWVVVTEGRSRVGDKFADFGDTEWRTLGMQGSQLSWGNFGRLIRKVEQPKKAKAEAKPKYRMLKIGEIIPYNTEYETAAGTWERSLADGTRYDQIDKDGGLVYRVPITAETKKTKATPKAKAEAKPGPAKLRPKDTTTALYMDNGDILKAAPISAKGDLCDSQCVGCYFDMYGICARHQASHPKANAWCTKPKNIRWTLTRKKWK